jgi:aconitase B
MTGRSREVRGEGSEKLTVRLGAEATTWRGSARMAAVAASLGKTPALHRRAPSPL